MAIITISRESFSHGREIAERVAQSLGYESVSREILIEASKFFEVPELKLVKYLDKAPSVLNRLTHGKEEYLSYIRAALLEHVKNDNVVYHGHAAHLLLPNISHVLRVRVIAEMEGRIALKQERENISRDEAVALIKQEDKDRDRWTQYLYKVDVNDPRFYDTVINVDRMTIEHACHLICCAAKLDAYKATPESRKAINDMAVSSHVSALLQSVCDAEVTADDGLVHVRVHAEKIRKTGYARAQVEKAVRERMRADLYKQVVALTTSVPGVKHVSCDIDLPEYV